MPIVFQDTFTDTNTTVLSAHAPDVGVSWNPITGGASGTISENTFRSPSGYTTVVYEAVAENTVVNGYVEASKRQWTDGDDNYLTLYFAYQDANNHYYVEWALFNAIRTIKLWKRVAGVSTQIGSTYNTGALTDDTYYPLRLTKSEGALSVQFNGSTVISGTDGSPLTTPSHARFSQTNQSSSSRLDNFIVFSDAEPEPSLVLDAQPGTTASGYVIDPPVVVQITTNGTTVDTSAIDDVTAELIGGGVLVGTLTIAAVAGVATFNDLRVCEEGVYTLRFAVAGFADVDTDSFTVTSGGGSTIISGESMSRPIKDGETVAAKKRIPVKLRDSANAPTAASMAGRKAQLSANGGSETPSTNDLVHVVGTIRGYIELTNTEAASFTPGDYVEARVDGDTGLLEDVGYAEIFPDDVYAVALSDDSIADEVQTRTIAAVTTVNALAPNSVNASALAADFVTEVQTGLATSAALATVSGKVDAVDDLLDTELPALTTAVAAVKTKTDNLPASPAAVGSAMVLSSGGLLEVVNAVVRAANGADGYAVEKDVPNNRIVLTIPGVGTVNIPASFSESSPAVDALGG